MNRETVGPVRRARAVRPGRAVLPGRAVRPGRAGRPGTAISAGLLAIGVMLAGCSSSSEPAPDASAGTSAGASADATASANVSPSPASTLSPEEQQAFEEATEVVLAYRQTITDLYSGARTNLNDLNEVATGDLVDQDLKDIQSSIGDGWRVEPEGVQVAVASSEPVQVNLAEVPEKVVVRVCLDAKAVTEVAPDGTSGQGIRELLDYTVRRTTYLPDPGWAVAKVTTSPNGDKERQC